MQDLVELSGELEFPVYQIGEEITEPGVIVLQQHCICVLPRTARNEMIAEELQT